MRHAAGAHREALSHFCSRVAAVARGRLPKSELRQLARFDWRAHSPGENRSMKQLPDYRVLPFRSSCQVNFVSPLSLGRRILLASRRHAVNDRDADQTEHAHSDPFLRDVKHVGADRNAGDEYDVAGDVNPE